MNITGLKGKQLNRSKYTKDGLLINLPSYFFPEQIALQKCLIKSWKGTKSNPSTFALSKHNFIFYRLALIMQDSFSDIYCTVAFQEYNVNQIIKDSLKKKTCSSCKYRIYTSKITWLQHMSSILFLISLWWDLL